MPKVPKVKVCAFTAYYLNTSVPRAHTSTLDHFRALKTLGTSCLFLFQIIIKMCIAFTLAFDPGVYAKRVQGPP